MLRTASKSRAPKLPIAPAPMLATLSAGLPTPQCEYAFEFKWDGARTMAACDSKSHALYMTSRNDLDVTPKYPELHLLPTLLPKNTTVLLDGEIISQDKNGHPSFPLLQNRMHVTQPATALRLSKSQPVLFIPFDILHLNGRSLLDLPYTERREILESLKLDSPVCRPGPVTIGHGDAIFKTAQKNLLEGLIAKKLESTYTPGIRSRDWLKIKIIMGQEFVVGGWTPQRESTHDPNRIGSLLLGYYGPDKKLHFAGGVGSGIAEAHQLRLRLLLEKHAAAASPFVDLPRMKTARFIDPKLVVQVEYRRWPEGGLLHQVAYKGLRTDKNPRKIVKETPTAVIRQEH